MNTISHHSQTTETDRSCGECTVTDGRAASEDRNNTGHFAENKIFEYLASLGFRTKFVGTRYMSDISSMICRENLGIPLAVTKDIYPVCARKFGTTPSAVERSIRHAIEMNYLETESDCLFGGYPKRPNSRPGNKEVICYLANHIMLCGITLISDNAK